MSIVTFEETIKKSSKRPSDIFLDLSERLHDAKNTGTLQGDELAKIEILSGMLFANLILMGKRTREDVDDFNKDMIKENVFSHNHDYLDFAYESNLGANEAAVFNRENRFSKVR